MPILNYLDTMFVVTAFLFQIILIVHFALRKWRFDFAIRYGPSVYALSIPACAVSVLLWVGGKSWSFCLAGFLYLVWAIFGYIVEYIQKINWRSPVRWPIFGPYILLYLTTIMFYWFPLALIWKPLWYIYMVLFVSSTILNVFSHKGA
jgi:hypothetical protein